MTQPQTMAGVLAKARHPAGERLLGGMPIAEVEELAWQEMDAVE